MILKEIASLADQPERIILGLMSGTSADGLDLALCRFVGSGSKTKVELLEHGTCEYSEAQSEKILKLATSAQIGMEDLCIAHTELAIWHAEMVRSKLREWNLSSGDVDLISWHGQTIRHAPKRIHNQAGRPDATFQLGESDHLAHLTGIPVVYDLRQKHVAAGGEGAPLAVYGDQLLFAKEGEYRILLNIGGIANLTELDGSTYSNNNVLPLTFDTGPGNTLMNAWVRKHFPPARFDESGNIAAKGQVLNELLMTLKSHTYFSDPPPKTTGPELLSLDFLMQALAESGTMESSPVDILASLTRFTAETIADAIRQFTNAPNEFDLYVSGGGVHNRTLIEHLQDCLSGVRVWNFERLGIPADAKEAVFFAALANEFICGNRLPVISSEGKLLSVLLGKLSLS